MSFQAVIFDLDGTLLNTIQDIADSMNIVLKQNNFPIHSINEYKYLIGKGIEQLVYQSLPKEFQSRLDIINNCTQAMIKEYSRHWDKKTKPYKGIIELLKVLKNKKIKIAVLSNKKDDFTNICVKKLLKAIEFDLIRGAMPSMPLKPDPSAALEIAIYFELNPYKIIYVGDTNIDMKTALAAKMYPVGVSWGFRPTKELLENGAKVILNKPAELLNLLN